jgi:hypothetical protein
MIHFLDVEKAKELNRIPLDQTMTPDEVCIRAAKIIGKSEKRAFPNGMSLADGMEWASKQSAQLGCNYASWLAYLSFCRYRGRTVPVKYDNVLDFAQAIEMIMTLCNQFSWSCVFHNRHFDGKLQSSISVYPTRDSGEF